MKNYFDSNWPCLHLDGILTGITPFLRKMYALDQHCQRIREWPCLEAYFFFEIFIFTKTNFANFAILKMSHRHISDSNRHQNTTPQHIVNQLFSSCMLFRWLNSFIKWKNRDAMTQKTSVTDIDEVEYSGSYVIGHDHWLSDHNVWGFAVQTGTNSWWHSMNNDDQSSR